MTTTRRAWQQREQKAAALFGARRNVLSGSANRDDCDSSDSTHPRLFIECKLWARHAVFTLWDATKRLAKETGKVPVLILGRKFHDGFLVCCHSDDLKALVIEWCSAQSSDEFEEIVHQIRDRQLGEGKGLHRWIQRRSDDHGD
jgi:hypothetical protein